MVKLKTFFLALLLMVIPKSLWAYTVSEIITINNLKYEVLTVTGVHQLRFVGTEASVSGTLTIPGTFNNGQGTSFIVTEIGARTGVTTSPNVTSVIIPETVTKIGASSFDGSKITKVSIPKSVTDIDTRVWALLGYNPQCIVDGDNPAFESTTEGILYTRGKEELRSIPSTLLKETGQTTYVVDENVKHITFLAFNKLEGLQRIVLPKNLAKVDEGSPSIASTQPLLEAFEIAPGGNPNYEVKDDVLFTKGLNKLVFYPYAKNVADYKVPDGVKEIASYGIVSNQNMTRIDLNQVTKINISALVSLNKLTTIKLPKDLKREGLVEGAFENCQSLEAYEVADGNTDFYAKEGVLFSADKQILYFYPLAKPETSYTIPATVKTISVKSFMGARKIVSLVIPASVEYLNEQAFRQTNLETVTFLEQSNMKKIDNYVFWQCPKLREVTLPSSITAIGKAFVDCKMLETINVPGGSKLQTIEEDAFSRKLDNLKHVNFLGSCELKTIKKNAFANLPNLESFIVPKTVTSIELNAFNGCAKLATVEFDPNADIQTIGAGAFSNCGLQNFTVPSNVQTIEREAFNNCQALTVVNVSEKTTSISPEAFKSCSNLTAINVSKKNTEYSSVDGYLLSKNKETLKIFPPGKANEHFTLLPPSITAIGDYAFYNCQELKNVTIPNLVTSIGKRAFGGCSNLNTITFLCDNKIDPANINQNPSERSFDDGNEAPNLMDKIDIHVRQEKLSDYNSDPFYNGKFKSISPSFVKDTEEYIAVSDNSVDMLKTTRQDETFVLPTTVTHDSKTYKVSMIGDYAFQHVSSGIKEVVVKKDVEYIGAQAFITNRTDTTSIIKSVFFIESNPTNQMLSTTRFDLDDTGKNYNEFAKTTTIYVKKTALPVYQEKWAKKVYKIATDSEEKSPYDFTSQLEFKIKDVKISKKYGTFAREFDVDFSDYYNEKHRSEVAAFVASTKILDGPGDYGTATKHVQMTSVDKKGGYTASYSYVPAYTGVLLKVLDKEATDADFYYTIGEQDQQVYNVTNNVMTGVTVNPLASLVATAAAPIYVMQGGTFRKAENTISNFPIHKAYMKFSALPAGTRVVFDFDDTTTGIESIESIDTGCSNHAADVYYNLQGQRINKPQQAGLYILNGAKVIIK